jgi:putative ABC transport system permease protein
MFRNYLKVAFRNILKHKFYSALNIAGLAFGLTACFLIGLYIFDDLSYDTFHKDATNVYRIGLMGKIAGQEINTSSSCSPLAQTMVADIPGVEQATRINGEGNLVMKFGDKALVEQDVIYADSNFFEFFTFELLEGDAHTALKEPNTLVLTKEAATRYFGDESALGKIMTVGNDNKAFTVTGIAKTPPHNSHIKFEIVLSAASNERMRSNQWLSNSFYTYYRKNPNTSIASIEAKLKEMVIKHTGPELEAGLGISFADFEKQGGIYAYYSFPMLDSHLYKSDMDNDLSPRSDIKNVYFMGAIGIFILLIACINFMNLSTARSASRAKEVGLRKTLGSLRSTLMVQFIAESFVYTFTGTALAIVAVYALLPGFNLLAGKELEFTSILSVQSVIGVGIVFFVVSILAGSYPAFYLTSFNPVDVLKGKARSGMKSKGIRSVLVVVQFTISIALIISTMVVYNQLSYLQDKNIGLDKQHVLVLRNARRLTTNMDAFKESLSNTTGIASSSYTNNVFPGVNNTTVFRAAGTTQDHIMGSYFADYSHMDVLRMTLAEGRYFSKDFPSDSSACVINEAALKELGWTTAVNQKLTTFNGEKPLDMHVVGVVKDFNFESFKSKVRPLVILLTAKSNNMLIRYEGSAQEAVTKVESLWKKNATNEPFEYTFLDENFDELFREEQRLGQVFSAMTGIAIFIACLGLLGLASFTAEQRTKEIGIRKVMGASVSSVSAMLSKEFMILVGISFVVACGLTWYFMNSWLSTFAYRIELSAGVFALGGFIAAAIAWLTVSFHFIKAARSNPAVSIRNE